MLGERWKKIDWYRTFGTPDFRQFISIFMCDIGDKMLGLGMNAWMVDAKVRQEKERDVE